MIPQRVVATNSLHYNEERHFGRAVPGGWRLEKRRDLLSAPRYLLYRLSKLTGPESAVYRAYVRLRTLHAGGGRGADLFHFWNSVSTSSVPWVVTFETAVPRWDAGSRFGLRLLAGDACRRVIAASGCAARIQEHHLAQAPDDLAAAVRPKLTVLHPAQAPQVESFDEKDLPDDEDLHFLFVGRQFFVKGGLEMLRAFARVLDEGYPVRLTVVSTLETGGLVSRSGPEELREATAVLRRHGERIRHEPRLPNAQVVELMRRSHVALLPSYADTYGYTVLEAQACATPVITTSVRALPELNGPEVGWRIEIPTDELGFAEIGSDRARARASALIEEGVYQAVVDACGSPGAVKRRGRAALERIRREHDPATVSSRLAAIYNQALTS